MKLFKSLLVAPATLGLLAPMTASANEVTINDFNAAEEIAVTNSRVAALKLDSIILKLVHFQKQLQHLSVLILLLVLLMVLHLKKQNLPTQWVLA